MAVIGSEEPATSPTVAPRGLPRLFRGLPSDERPTTLHEHIAQHGPLEACSNLIELVEASGLQGRGGGCFPTGKKLRAVAAQRGRPTVVVNAAEGELVSHKDKVLVRYAPHLVLDGAVTAAASLGATRVIVAVGRGAHAEVALGQVLTERSRDHYDGRVDLEVAVIPDGFVAGEESAVINVLNGGPAKPTSVPPRPFERGVGGAPTLVQNAETFAHLALIARYGPTWFRELGSPSEPGSALVTASGAVAEPGVYEVALGTPLEALLTTAGGATEPLRALLVGGYFGSWIGAESLAGLRLLNSDLASVGASLGARAVAALPETVCGVCESARATRYLAEQSAGQCGPCVFGLAAIAAGFEALATGSADRRAELRRWLQQVEGRGACRHPDGVARFVASALRVFASEIQAHLRDGGCRGGGRRVLPEPAVVGEPS